MNSLTGTGGVLTQIRCKRKGNAEFNISKRTRIWWRRGLCVKTDPYLKNLSIFNFNYLDLELLSTNFFL